MSNLQDLEAALMAANKARSDVERQINDFKQAAKLTAEKESQERFGSAYSAAGTVVFEARRALQDEQDRIARTGTGALLPIGEKYEKWETKGYGRNLPFYKTGTFGVIEVITKDSEHADNMSSYRHADIGQTVLRLLKKDSSLSKKYLVVVTAWNSKTASPPYGWHKEGIDPNKGTL